MYKEIVGIEIRHKIDDSIDLVFKYTNDNVIKHFKNQSQVINFLASDRTLDHVPLYVTWL